MIKNRYDSSFSYFLLSALVAATLTCTVDVAASEQLSFDAPNATLEPGMPTVEGSFRYEAVSGALYRGNSRGNPPGDLEGRVTFNGGIAQFVRNDVEGGLFLFEAFDIGQQSYGAVGIEVNGYLNGVILQTQIFTTPSVTNVFATHVANNFAGVKIDELRVHLDATNTGSRWESIDNLVLRRIPEPASLMLVIAVMAGLVVGGARKEH